MPRSASLRVPASLLTVCALSGLAACSAPQAGDRGADPATPLTVVGPFEVHSLDPSTSNGFFTLLGVAETLVATDGEGALLPGLASSWEASDDGLLWRFTLRPGATFHDGTPVTADAVVAALTTAAGKEGTPLATVPLASVEPDGEDVVVRLTGPFAPLPAVLAHTSTQVLAPAAYAADGTVTEVIGSGPYEVEAITPPQRIDVAVSDDWTGGTPAIGAVRYLAVGRSESRALMAESGEADVTFGMDPTSLQRLTGADGLDIVSVTLPRTIQLKVNSGHAILGDVRVRQALSLALDREGMATALLRDPEMAATQLFPPSLPDWHQDDLDPLEHAPDRARDLLAEAGWQEGPDGVLVRDGRRFAVTLRTFPDRPELPPLAAAIQGSLAEIGVAVDVQVGSSSEIPAGHQDGSLELALYARNFSLVPDPTVTLLGDFAPEGSDWGAMGWADDGLTAAVGELLQGDAAGDGAAARGRIAEIMQSELPVIPVAWYRQSAVVGDRVEGVELDPLERSWRIADMTWAD